MRAIIIAAGMGRRLRPYTEDRPKCMVPVAGRPILHHQLRALDAYGVRDIVIVRGYLGDRIELPAGHPFDVRFIENTGFESNNILMSLFTAGADLVGDVIVSYADIVYHPDAVGALLASPFLGTLVVDRRWRETYIGRTDHPISEAELCRVAPGGPIIEVGKHVGPERAFGEFIGLARFASPLVARLWSYYLQGVYRGEDAPFGWAASLRQAYLTDLVNVAIQHGERFFPAPIHGCWREIDTVQDLERAQQIVNW